MKSILLLACLAVAGFAAQWNALPQSGTAPSPRESAVMGHLRDYRLIVAQGYQQDFTSDFGAIAFYNDSFIYHIQTDVWNKINSSGPSNRTFHSGASDLKHNKFYVFGGLTFPPTIFPITVFSDLWAFDGYTNQWSLVPQNNAGPGDRAGSCMVVDDGILYVSFGLSDDFNTHNDMWKFDTVSGLWTQLLADDPTDNGVPHRRYRIPCALTQKGNGNAKGIIIHSGDLILGDSAAPQNDTWIFHIKQNKWELLNTGLENRQDSIGVFANGNYYVAFGDTESPVGRCVNNATGVGNNIQNNQWTLPISNTHTWNQVATLNTPVATMRMAFTVVENVLYTWGGFSWGCTVPGDGTAVSNTILNSLDLEDI